MCVLYHTFFNLLFAASVGYALLTELRVLVTTAVLVTLNYHEAIIMDHIYIFFFHAGLNNLRF